MPVSVLLTALRTMFNFSFRRLCSSKSFHDNRTVLRTLSAHSFRAASALLHDYCRALNTKTANS